MQALQWFNDIVQWFGRLFPRITLVPPTHAGVLFGPRGGASNKRAGLVVWWPLIFQLVKIPTTTQSIAVSARSMPHTDAQAHRFIVPRVAICGLSVQYRVVDAVKAAVRVLDLHALVDNRCQAAIGAHWDNLESASTTVKKAVVDMRPWLLADYGVDLERVDVTHLGLGVCVLTLNDYGWSDDRSGTERGASGGL